MTKNELMSKFNEHGKLNEFIYVFGTYDLEKSPDQWVFGMLTDFYTYRNYNSFGIRNHSNSIFYCKYIVCFNDFNPYDMKETLKHVIPSN